MSEIQSILFSKGKWNTRKARTWLKTHDFIPLKKAHTTKNYYRYQIRKPMKGRKFKTIGLTDGVKAVVRF